MRCSGGCPGAWFWARLPGAQKLSINCAGITHCAVCQPAVQQRVRCARKALRVRCTGKAMRKHKSHAVGDLCKRGVTLPSWQALEASLARDAAATPPPGGAINDSASTDAARALAGDRAKLLTGGADGDALRALVALLSGAVVPDDAAAAAGGARVLAGDDGPLIQVLAAATLDETARAAAAAAYQSMRLAAGCEPDEADTAENILAADKIAADTDATIEL